IRRDVDIVERAGLHALRSALAAGEKPQRSDLGGSGALSTCPAQSAARGTAERAARLSQGTAAETAQGAARLPQDAAARPAAQYAARRAGARADGRHRRTFRDRTRQDDRQIIGDRVLERDDAQLVDRAGGIVIHPLDE